MSGVAKRYARALFEIAKERGLIDRIETELNGIVQVINGNEELTKILTHPHISVEAKNQLISDLFKERVAEETFNFLLIVMENRRQAELGQITQAYVKIANEARGIADAVVTTAKPLSEEEQAEIAEQFGRIVNKTLRVQTVVDPAILGGIVIKIGDRLYDGSMKSKLEHFAHQ